MVGLCVTHHHHRHPTQAQWHAALPNASDIERLNAYISYCPTWMKPLDREYPTLAHLEARGLGPEVSVRGGGEGARRGPPQAAMLCNRATAPPFYLPRTWLTLLSLATIGAGEGGGLGVRGRLHG